MKTHAILCAILVTALTLSCLKDGQLVEGPASIEFDTEIHDFGKLRRNTKVTHEFGFRNAGGETLTIEEIRKSCGCTVARAIPEAIPPGQRGVVEVEFNTQSYKGKIEKKVRVHSNDPERPVVSLTVKTTVVVDFTVRPVRLHFGRVRQGDSVTKRVQLVPEELENLRIERVESSSRLVEAEVIGEDLNPKGKGLTVDVTFSPTELRLPKTQYVTIFTNSEEQPTVEIPVYAGIEPN